MIKEIFTRYRNKINFESIENLNNKLSSIDTRIINYKNLERERYYIVSYLATIGNHNVFQYPIEVEYIDLGLGVSVPDFRINDSGYEYFLEVTMATKTELINQLDELKNAEQLEFNISIDGEEIKVESYESKKDKDGNYYLSGRPVFGDMAEAIKIVSNLLNY